MVLPSFAQTSALDLFNSATAKFNQGDFDAASAAFERVIELKSPLAPAARLSVAKCLRRVKRWDDAAKMLFDPLLADENLRDALAGERRRLGEAMQTEATHLLEAGNSGEALGLLDKAGSFEKDGEVIYARGLALVALLRYDEAREAFRNYLGEANRPYASDARYFLYRLESGIGRGATWLNLEVGAGYNSNVFTTTESNSPVSTPAAVASVSGGWQLTGHDNLSLRAGYSGYWLENFGQIDGRYVAHQVLTEVGYHDADWTLRLLPSAGYQTLGTAPYRLQAGAEVDLRRALGRFGVGLRYSGNRDYAQSSVYSYIDGDDHWGEIHVDFLSRYFELQLLYIVYYENIGDLTSGTVTLPLNDVAQGPALKVYWAPFAGWESSLSLTYFFRSYAHLYRPGNVERNDHQLLGSARVSHRLVAGLSAFASLGVVINKSTVDRDYTQYFGLAGFSWNALN